MSTIANKEIFREVMSSDIIEILVQYPLVIFDTKKGRFVITLRKPKSRRGLSQMLKLLNLKYREFVHLMMENPEKARNLLLKNMRDDLIISGRLSSNGMVYVVHRVTTPEFRSVKHEELFSFIEGVLRDAGIEIIEKKTLRYKTRFGYAYIIGTGRVRVPSADIYKWGIAVTNSNIGMKAIHVYAYFEFEGCGNELIIPSVHVVHKGALESVLMRVKKALEIVLDRISNMYIPQVETAFEKLAELPVTEDVIRTWLEVFRKRYGKKHARYLENAFKKYMRIYGENKYAILQALTEVSTRTKAETIKEYLNKEAIRLVAEAIGKKYRSEGM